MKSSKTVYQAGQKTLLQNSATSEIELSFFSFFFLTKGGLQFGENIWDEEIVTHSISFEEVEKYD